MAAFQAITVAAAGVTVTASGTSAAAAIPNAADGNRARFVRIQATGAAYVKPGTAGVTCTANDLLIGSGEAVILSVKAFSHIAYLQEAAGPKINIAPVEF